MMPSKYSLERQAEAVKIAALTSQEEAERQTGIPQQTIGRWMATMPEHVNELVASRRAAIVDNLLGAVEAATEALRTGLEAVRDGDPVTSPRDLQHLATAAGIAQDKLAAIQGGGITTRFGAEPNPTPALSERAVLFVERVLSEQRAGRQG